MKALCQETFTEWKREVWTINITPFVSHGGWKVMGFEGHGLVYHL